MYIAAKKAQCAENKYIGDKACSPKDGFSLIIFNSAL